MREIRHCQSDDPQMLRRAYRVNATTIIDVWCRHYPNVRDGGPAIDNIVEQIDPSAGRYERQYQTYYAGDEWFSTDVLYELKLPIATWEEFLADPEPYLIEALL